MRLGLDNPPRCLKEEFWVCTHERTGAGTRTQNLAGRVGISTSYRSGLCLGSLLHKYKGLIDNLLSLFSSVRRRQQGTRLSTFHLCVRLTHQHYSLLWVLGFSIGTRCIHQSNLSLASSKNKTNQ